MDQCRRSCLAVQAGDDSELPQCICNFSCNSKLDSKKTNWWHDFTVMSIELKEDKVMEFPLN